MITRKPIYVVFPEQSPRKAMEELSIDKSQLRNFIGDSFEILNHSSLSSFLLEYLDVRALIKIVKLSQEENNSIALSLNGSLKTLQSEEFRSFNNALSNEMRRNIIISLHIGEVYKDLAQFFIVRDALKDYGYKICLEGLDDISFLSMDRAILGIDLMQINFQYFNKKINIPEIERQLKEKIKIAGSSRIIMENCDNEESYNIGIGLGICLYAGKYFVV